MFKEGDTVVVINPDTISRSKGIEKYQLSKVIGVAENYTGVLCEEGFFYLSEVVNKEIYDSPLYKSMSELNEEEN